VSDAIEDFFKAHQYTVAALGVLATFSAVAVSLVVAIASQRANRTRIRAYASIIVLAHQTIDRTQAPRYLTVDVTNHGLLPAVIPLSFFIWSVPFRRVRAAVLPWDYSANDKWIAQKHYPIEIKPRNSQTFFLSDLSMFREGISQNFLKPNSLINRILLRFLRARVETMDGRRFNVKLSDTIHRQVAQLIVSRRRSGEGEGEGRCTD
jgi:hypothetical protein